MNKKLISALLSVTMIISGAAAFADTPEVNLLDVQAKAVQGEQTGEDITLKNIAGDKIIVNGYDNSGKLVYSSLLDVENQEAHIPAEAADYSLKAYIIEENAIYDIMLKETPTETPVPTVSPSPSETPEPTHGPTPTPAPYNPNDFPAVYEKAINALYAPAVVEKVVLENFGSENGTRIDYYYQGEKHSDWFGTDVPIVSAPDSAPEMVNASLSDLKRGDVIYLNRRMNGTVKEIALIYKAQSKDILDGDYGTNFQKLFSVQDKAVAGFSGWGVQAYGTKVPHDGTFYAFGLSAKRENTILYLLNKEASVDKNITLSLSKDAMVYICDMNSNQGIETSNIAAIPADVARTDWDNALSSNDKKINLDELDHDYVLARIVDGTVMDVVVYTNY